jgi:hypothetical protein
MGNYYSPFIFFELHEFGFRPFLKMIGEIAGSFRCQMIILFIMR